MSFIAFTEKKEKILNLLDFRSDPESGPDPELDPDPVPLSRKRIRIKAMVSNFNIGHFYRSKKIGYVSSGVELRNDFFFLEKST